MLDGRAIGLCNFHRRRGGRRREVAPLRRRRSIAGIRHERIAQVLVDHARRTLRRGSVEIAYATGRDGALEQDSVSEARRGKFSGVARTSGDLEAPVDAIHGQSRDFPSVTNVWRSIRRELPGIRVTRRSRRA
jgi:hypothetical protein